MKTFAHLITFNLLQIAIFCVLLCGYLPLNQCIVYFSQRGELRSLHLEMSVNRPQTMNYAVCLWCISTLSFLCSKTGIYRKLKLAEHKIAEASSIQIACYLWLFLSLTVNFKYCGYIEFVLKHNVYRWWGEKPHCRAIFATVLSAAIYHRSGRLLLPFVISNIT